MPRKTLVNFTCEDELLRDIDDLRFSRRHPSRAFTVKLLIKEGLTRMKALESGDVTATPTT